MSKTQPYDVAVIGAGVFGAWTAWHLARRGQRVLLADAYGPAHSRASSGGESRIIRMSYGADELYTRWSQRSLVQWKALFESTHQPLFEETGVLWLAGDDTSRLQQSIVTLKNCAIAFEELDRADLEQLYPQVNFAEVHTGLLEPQSGVLLARRAVACVVADARKQGVDYRVCPVVAPKVNHKAEAVLTSAGETIAADQFVFACGPWLGKIFPEVLGEKIFPTRQEVFFFGTPLGDARYTAPALPTWLFQGDEVYGMPDIEGRGLKLARDAHGEIVDPDTQSCIASADGVEWARQYVARRFPALRDAPLVETRVCQYENTSSGDFLIDRHPQMENVWLAGGGSGHGFKHGPAFGEYVAGQLLDGAPAEPRFSLATKETMQRRAIF
ncbi:MAG: N-methyl-L-tryptophan oxidase [Candidatus Acidiferrum sp.]